MQIDLFAESDAFQRGSLLRLERASVTRDFTDRDEVFQLQAVLHDVSALLGRCMTLESLYIHPLLAGTGTCGFELVSLQNHLRGQLDLLADRLDNICDHVQRFNPSWQAALIMEGRGFQQQVTRLVNIYMRQAHRRYSAMAEIRSHHAERSIAAAHEQMSDALASLKQMQGGGTSPQAVLRRATRKRSASRRIRVQSAV